ncbi:hypothetical protein [Acinetobacter stercoris]|uniref:Uncharacterized protein n=1 Tax=Acinetobacter stercoris TaxID=2126983 RepID=A0A2U3N1U2_9GAMM|nr:hypothetical protein [Acinetobacter stercoris]SPL71632.1 hypothetical protein KPC_2810 [Acinetobacter stercoris]
MTLSYKILLFAFIVATIFFIILGLYTLDFALLIVAILFAVATLLVILENKQLMRNPFRKK